MSERSGHETQSFIHQTEPREASFDPPSNTEEVANKPEGGLWTSTLRDDRTSGWLDWCQAEQWGLTDESNLYVLEPEGEVSVLVIDSEADLQSALGQWGRSDSGPSRIIQTFARLDFEAISTEYDAIHLTDQGQRETRFATPGLYGWDSECTLWLRWAFRSVEELGRVEENTALQPTASGQEGE